MPDKTVLRKASEEALAALSEAVTATIPDEVKIAIMSADDGRRGWATALLRSAAASAWAKAAAAEKRLPEAQGPPAPAAPTQPPSSPQPGPSPPASQPAPPAAPSMPHGDAGPVPPGTGPAVPAPPPAPAGTRPCAEYLAGLLRQKRLTEDGFSAYVEACQDAGLEGPYRPEDALSLDEMTAYRIGQMAGAPRRSGRGRPGGWGRGGGRRY